MPALEFLTWVGSEKSGRRLKDIVGLTQRGRRDKLISLQWRSCSSRQRRVSLGFHLTTVRILKVTPAVESGNFYACFDGNWLLKKKGQEVASNLNGRCIFLVGMMGSGKTTVGKILSEALGYSFVDSDTFVEKAVGGTSVSQIFNQCGEKFFRDYESEALRKLASIPKQVVATGGGAVVRPINWKYMKQGVSVFLDVPLDALARRIADAFVGLFTLSKKRTEAYANADATVSLQHVAARLGLEDISDITPAAIAMEVLVQIENYLQGKNGTSIGMFP
ncbi:hypothetical protein AAG906_022574 [Vitis piasezkii]